MSCWRDTSRWYVVVVLVLVLDPIGTGLHQLYFFDYENEDEDEKHSYRHFRASPLKSLLSNCPEGAPFSERSLGKSLVSFSIQPALSVASGGRPDTQHIKEIIAVRLVCSYQQILS